MLPTAPSLDHHEIVSQEEWLKAREKHFANEVRLTHELDELRAERRALPWVKVEEDYVFDGPDGDIRLPELFAGRRQLVVQHFMQPPGSSHVCQGCAFISDHVDSARQHFENADLAFAAVARASITQIEDVKRRMGWTFPWVSSGNNRFSYDFDVSFSEEDRADGGAAYNYGKERIKGASDMFGISVFVMPEKDGEIFHTYSTFRRGAEQLMGALNWLDLAPLGRNERDGTHSWLRLHDAY